MPRNPFQVTTRKDSTTKSLKGREQFAGLFMRTFLITFHSVCISQPGKVFVHAVITTHWMSHEIGPQRAKVVNKCVKCSIANFLSIKMHPNSNDIHSSLESALSRSGSGIDFYLYLCFILDSGITGCELGIHLEWKSC